MREILFRGKRLDNGEWVESGSISRVSDDGVNWDYYLGAGAPAMYMLDEYENMLAAFTKAECVFYRVDPDSIGQYTGLTDKNGMKIFEGDIVKAPFCGRKFCTATIHFITGGFYAVPTGGVIDELRPWKYHLNGENRNMVVIGNIYDNPELLRGAE